MKFGSLFGWGIVIYAVMFLSWDGLIIYGFSTGILPRVIELLVLIIVATIAGRSLRFNSWHDILPYSIAWAIMMGLLDAIFTVPFSGWGVYANWNLWIGYTLVALIPLLAPKTRLVHHEARDMT